MVTEGLLYTKEHEWLRQEEDGSVTIGITDHAQSALGDLVYVELPEVGATFEKGQVFFIVFIPEGDPQEALQALDDIIIEPAFIQYRDDVVIIGAEGGFRNLLQVIAQGFALVGQDQAGVIERVTPEHAAHSIADELLHRLFKKE